MAGISASGNTKSEHDSTISYTVPLVLMVSLFFMIGFITVLNDVLIPCLKGLFDLKPWQAMLIQLCFFGAYFIMSVPAGMIISKIGYKKGLTLALLVIGLGLILFVPASIVISYAFFLFALFVIGLGLSILQVAINPYIVALGPEETGAARLNLAGALNSTATFIGPIIGAAFILPHGITDPIEKASAVRGPYIILALITIGIALVLYFIKLPKLKTEVDSGEKLEGSVWQYKHLLYGAGAIFFYVGAEVAIGSILILYLMEDHLVRISANSISSFTLEKAGSSFLAYYWWSAMVGRLIGSFIGQKIKAEIMLRVVSLLAVIFVGLSISGIFLNNWMTIKVIVLNPDPFSLSFQPIQVPLSVFFLVLVGLLNSVMWPCIFPLSLKGLGKHTSQGSGILVSMVVGGAIIPVIQGFLAGSKSIGYQYSFIIVLACYMYILFFAMKGHVNKHSDTFKLSND